MTWAFFTITCFFSCHCWTKDDDDKKSARNGAIFPLIKIVSFGFLVKRSFPFSHLARFAEQVNFVSFSAPPFLLPVSGSLCNCAILLYFLRLFPSYTLEMCVYVFKIINCMLYIPSSATWWKMKLKAPKKTALKKCDGNAASFALTLSLSFPSFRLEVFSKISSSGFWHVKIWVDMLVCACVCSSAIFGCLCSQAFVVLRSFAKWYKHT